MSAVYSRSATPVGDAARSNLPRKNCKMIWAKKPMNESVALSVQLAGLPEGIGDVARAHFLYFAREHLLKVLHLPGTLYLLLVDPQLTFELAVDELGVEHEADGFLEHVWRRCHGDGLSVLLRVQEYHRPTVPSLDARYPLFRR